jgi:hypothetical protein
VQLVGVVIVTEPSLQSGRFPRVSDTDQTRDHTDARSEWPAKPAKKKGPGSCPALSELALFLR